MSRASRPNQTVANATGGAMMTGIAIATMWLVTAINAIVAFTMAMVTNTMAIRGCAADVWKRRV